MKIAKVKLRNEGLKGLEVTWEHYETKNGVSFRIESKDKRNAPVHKELLACFEWLEKYLLISLDKENGTVDVYGVEIKNDGYILLGDLHTSTGLFSIKSPVLDHSNMEKFVEVENIIKGLLVELKEYMDGNKGMSVDEYVKKFNKGKEDFNENEYEGLSKEEKLNVYVSMIEKAGGIVMMPDDMELEEEPKTEPFTFNANGKDALSGKTINAATVNFLDEMQDSPKFIESTKEDEQGGLDEDFSDLLEEPVKIPVKKGTPKDDLDFEI